MTPNEAYKHPYHSEKFPIYWSTHNVRTFGTDVMGPEPVSPHYESFVLSRRVPLIGAAFCYTMNVMEHLNPGSFYGKAFTHNVYTVMLVSVGLLESRYLLMKLPTPKLTWFYDAYAEHEHKQMMLNWYDSLEESIRHFTSKSKEQIDYYLIHKEYLYVKKRILTAYLENERINLDENFKQRSISILNSIKNLENANIKKKLAEATEQSLNVILTKLKDKNQNKEIIDASFSSALSGLRAGEMKFEGDRLLPMFVEELKLRTAPLEKLSPEEENKLFSLTEDQRKFIISADNRAKADYLNKVPDVSTSIKNSDVYKEILNRMKNRVETTLKH